MSQDKEISRRKLSTAPSGEVSDQSLESPAVPGITPTTTTERNRHLVDPAAVRSLPRQMNLALHRENRRQQVDNSRSQLKMVSSIVSAESSSTLPALLNQTSRTAPSIYDTLDDAFIVTGLEALDLHASTSRSLPTYLDHAGVDNPDEEDDTQQVAYDAYPHDSVKWLKGKLAAAARVSSETGRNTENKKVHDVDDSSTIASSEVGIEGCGALNKTVEICKGDDNSLDLHDRSSGST